MVVVSAIVSIMVTVCSQHSLFINTIATPNVSAQYMPSSGYNLLKQNNRDHKVT
jgi:hypothetical protein